MRFLLRPSRYKKKAMWRGILNGLFPPFSINRLRALREEIAQRSALDVFSESIADLERAAKEVHEEMLEQFPELKKAKGNEDR